MRRTALVVSTGVLAAVLLVATACAAAAPPAGSAPGKPAVAQSSAAPPAAKPEGWDQLVAAARQEGTLGVLAPPGQEYRRILVEEFQKAYPGIAVDYTAGRLHELWSRMQAERATGRYLFDVIVTGGPDVYGLLKPAGAVAPLRPALLLPEVLDETAWFDNRLWWGDVQEPLTTLSFQGNVQLVVAYNKQLVDPSQFRSYRDLLDPRWKGKMASTDIRPGTVGGVSSRFLYKEPTLGPEFLDRLYSEMDVTLSADQRQLIDWLAQGQFALGLFLSPNPTIVAIEQGLPIDFIPGEQFQEGAPIGPSSGALALFEPAPHPNAARLFINWLLSREGQLAWQAHLKSPSLRTDIPRDGIHPALVPKPGVRYVDASGEAFGVLGDTTISDLVTRALEKRGR